MPYLYNEILPNPNTITTPGGFPGVAGSAGQPFKKVDLVFNSNMEVSRSIYGRTNLKRTMYPTWEVSLTYNPMTKEQFYPVHNFLMQSGGFRPFSVILPQYASPKDSLFAMYNHSNIFVGGSAGSTIITLVSSVWSSNDYSTTGLPSVGDMFNVNDLNDSQHSKAYIITGVDTYTDYREFRPTSGTIALHISPGLQKTPNVNSTVTFNNPTIRVQLSSDVIEYSLNNNDLYEFGLKLKEVL